MLEGWAIVDNTTGEDWTKVAPVAGVGTSDFVHQPALRAEVCRSGPEELPEKRRRARCCIGRFRRGESCRWRLRSGAAASRPRG